MTLRFIDSFDLYPTAKLSTRYNTVDANITIAAGGRSATNGLKNTNASNDQKVSKSFDSRREWIVGYAMYVSSAPSGARLAIAFVNAGVAQLQFYLNPDLSFSIKRPSSGVLGTSSGSINTGAWNYVEFDVQVGNADGFAKMKINGVSVMNLTSIDTQEDSSINTANSIYIYPIYNNTGWIDDLYICDSAGSTNNSFLGDCKVEAILPNDVGAYSEWTPTGGTPNYTVVDDTSPDDDATFVATSGVGYIDSYNFPSLVTTSGNIYGVQFNFYSRKDDAGTRYIAPLVRRDAVNYQGTNITVGDNYTYLTQIMETDPSDSLAWAIGDVNASEFGIVLVS